MRKSLPARMMRGRGRRLWGNLRKTKRDYGRSSSPDAARFRQISLIYESPLDIMTQLPRGNEGPLPELRGNSGLIMRQILARLGRRLDQVMRSARPGRTEWHWMRHFSTQERTREIYFLSSNKHDIDGIGGHLWRFRFPSSLLRKKCLITWWGKKTYFRMESPLTVYIVLRKENTKQKHKNKHRKLVVLHQGLPYTISKHFVW